MSEIRDRERSGWGHTYPDWIAVPTPAAGVTASYTVPGQYWQRIVTARASLTTDANAANRVVTLDYVNARGVTYCQNGPFMVVTASTTGVQFEWDSNRSVSEWAAGTPVWSPLLDAWLPAGFVVKFNVAAIQATDQLSALTLWVESYTTDPRGLQRGLPPSPYER